MNFESIQDLFSRVAGRSGDRTAIDSPGGSMTFRALEAASNSLAGYLLANGARRGARVAILAEDRSRVVTAILASLKAGCVFVPLDAMTPLPRLAAMLREATPEWMITETALLPLARELTSAQLRVVRLGLTSEEPGGGLRLEPYVETADPGSPGIVYGPDDMAYIYFTSGSTGNPKGIAGRLSGIDHFIRWEIETLGLAAGCRGSQLTTPAFDAFLRDVFTPLCAGGTVCVPESRNTVRDARLLIDWLDLAEVELVHCVPSLLRAVINADLNPGYFASLRYVLLSGEPLLPADVQRWMEIFGERILLVNLYGPTETTMTKLFHFVTAADRGRASIPIGKPMSGARALLIGSNGKVCPPRTIGEIYIRTPYRSLGYYQRPDLTAEVFLRNPFNPDPEDIVYRTGDLGRMLEDGSFEFLGRRDSQVKINGVRVELAEIENALRSYPGVRDVAVVAREAKDGTKSLCAYLVPAGEIGRGGLRQHLLANLPEVMVPSWFVVLNELPRTLSGKVNRQALPSPEEEIAETGDGLSAPRSLTEQLLSFIWRELLGIPRVGIHVSFFEVGGHSLLATRLLARMRAVFEVDVPLHRFFDSPTIAGLAEIIETAACDPGWVALPPIGSLPRPEPLPLSFAQRRLWFINVMEGEESAYNIHRSLLLESDVDLAALGVSLAEVVRRHEVLRTSYPTVDGQPMQSVLPAGPIALPVIDLGSLPTAHRATERLRLSKEEAVRHFRLDQGPAWRIHLVRLEDRQLALMITIHHVSFDAWSTQVLVREWSLLYAACLEGRPSPLPEPAHQYADYTLWERELSKGELREQLMAYWRRQLADAPTELRLPTDRPRPAAPSLRGALRLVYLPRPLTEDLGGLSRRAGATLYMTVLAGFLTLLCRHSGQTDLVIGTPSAGRGRLEFETMIGLFVNLIIVRGDLAGDPSFATVLGRVRRTILEALSHQNLPFEVIVEDLKPVREPGREPFLQVAFGYENVPRAESASAELRLRALEYEVTRVKLDLDLSLGEEKGWLAGALEYSTDLFDPATAERLMEHFQRLLESAIADPGRRISDLDMLLTSERQQLLVEWNDTHRPELAASIHACVTQNAVRWPERSAVVADGVVLTYGELDRRSNQLARHLADYGVGPEILVGVCLERSAAAVLALLAVLKVGGTYLPLDPAYPAGRLAFMLEDAQPAVLLVDASTVDRLPSNWALVVQLDTDQEAIAAASSAAYDGGACAENTAYVIYTSGSTGRPKGVRVPHRGLRNLAAAQVEAFGIRAEDHLLQLASLSFDASVSEIAMALVAGATLHVASQTSQMAGPELVRLLRDEQIVNGTFPPAVLSLLPEDELPELAGLVVAGEACPPELVERWAPGRRFFNAYGPTETSVCASLDRCAAGEGKPSIGRPIANAGIHLLDPAGQPVPVGVTGELYVGGAGLAIGYLNRPGLTAERFIPSPFATVPGERLYRTGDLARFLRDGRIDYLGRLDRQVKVRGFRIELLEVETALAAHPAVREAVVEARGDSPASRRLVGYVVLGEGDGARVLAEMRHFLLDRLPEPMVPSVLVPLAALPLTPSGKVDRQALPDPREEKAFEVDRRTPPRNPLEEELALLVSEVLELDRIGAHDNFFDLGGYSLAATQVLIRIRDRFGVELGLARFFERPTVAALGEDLAAALEQGLRSRVPPLERMPPVERPPLSFAQEVLWKEEQRDPGRTAAHVPALLQLQGELDPTALARTLREVLRRHEALRTVFPTAGGTPYQSVLPVPRQPLPQVDLSGLPADGRSRELDRLAAEEGRRLFDLARGPLVRLLLLRLDDRLHALLLVGHHIVTDQWSAGVFARELMTLYPAFANGETSPLQELPVQYTDYARWQKSWLQGGPLDEDLAYWRRQLAGAAPLMLPTNHPRSGQRSALCGTEPLPIPPALRAELHAFSRRQRGTLFMTLLAAFKLLLCERSGRTDVVVGSPIANRRRRELEPMIGFFPNMLVLRTDLTGDPTFLELLARVRRVTLDAFSHQDLPIEMLAADLAGKASLDTDRLNVYFNFYNAPAPTLELRGLRLTPRAVSADERSSELVLFCSEAEDSLFCGFFYRLDLWEASSIVDMKQRFQGLLETALAHPERRLSELLGRTVEGGASVAGLSLPVAVAGSYAGAPEQAL
jgi:amino acid adenylation domain-containing protein